MMLHVKYSEVLQELLVCQQHLESIQSVSQQWFDVAYASYKREQYESDMWLVVQRQYEQVVPKQRLDAVYDMYAHTVAQLKQRIKRLEYEIHVYQNALENMEMI